MIDTDTAPLALTLPEALDAAGGRHPSTAAIFPDQHTTLTMAELAEDSRGLATRLARLGVGAGHRVGVLGASEPDFLRALFAIIRTGATACPLPLPTALRGLDSYSAQLDRVLTLAGIREVLVSDGLGQLRRVLADRLPKVHLRTVAEVAAGPSASGASWAVEPDHAAIVQFTSGSTATPKGVLLSHRNVLCCLAAIVAGSEMGRSGDSGAIWLPLYHDMGLFGALSALLVGVPVTLWSPTSFIRKPDRWLGTMAAERHTMCPMPNFGYDHLVAGVSRDEVAMLDLSAWRVAFNGAEMIAADSVAAFLAHTIPAGFRPAAMLPVYGLAEATLAVTFPPLGRPPLVDWVHRGRLATDGVAMPVSQADPQARGVVALGHPVRGMRLRTAGPHTGRLVPERTVGEVQLRGPSVMSGYLLADPAATGSLEATQPFTPDGWLRTGDLGYLHAGELHLTGRATDMIVVRGINFYPEDVESTVRSVPAVYRRRCVAFADVTESTEMMVVVAETAVRDRRDRDRLADAIRECVLASTGLGSVDVHLAPPHSIPRTSSGKFQRSAAKAMVREGRTPQIREGV